MYNRNIDALCVIETWLAPQAPDSLIKVPGHNVFRHDMGRRNGVCIDVKDNLSSKVIAPDVGACTGAESIWITVQCFYVRNTCIDSVTLMTTS